MVRIFSLLHPVIKEKKKKTCAIFFIYYFVAHQLGVIRRNPLEDKTR